ncbi:MAG: outer membrane protein assembly factor BamD [bacterium]|nr:outer membrane protein assembly factor BamD [bacterium]
MKQTRFLSRLIIFAAIALLIGCSAGEKLSRRDSGDQAFERGDYPEAIMDYQLYLEDGLASEETMEAHFMLARSYFENKDFPTAAVEFEIFQRDYPQSDSLVAAAYYEALCWMKQSASYDRDSEPTEQAIRRLENFILDYPTSSYRTQAETWIAELNEMLAHKCFEIAVLYKKMKQPEAAIVYCDKLLSFYPGCSYQQDTILLLLELKLLTGADAEADRIMEAIQAEYAGTELEASARELMNDRP